MAASAFARRAGNFRSNPEVELDDHYLIALAKQGRKDAYDKIVKLSFSVSASVRTGRADCHPSFSLGSADPR